MKADINTVTILGQKLCHPTIKNANAGGGTDNITVIIAKTEMIQKEVPEKVPDTVFDIPSEQPISQPIEEVNEIPITEPQIMPQSQINVEPPPVQSSYTQTYKEDTVFFTSIRINYILIILFISGIILSSIAIGWSFVPPYTSNEFGKWLTQTKVNYARIIGVIGFIISIIILVIILLRKRK